MAEDDPGNAPEIEELSAVLKQQVEPEYKA